MNYKMVINDVNFLNGNSSYLNGKNASVLA